MKNIITYKSILFIFLFLLIGEQLNAYNVTRPNISFYGGLAVNSYTGNLFFKRNDLSLPGVGPSVDMTFAFNSSHRQDDQGFGKGWTFSQNLYYYPDSQGVWLSMATGKRHLFVENAGAYHAPIGVFDCFENYGPGLWRLSSPSGIIYYFEDSTHKHLTRVKDPNGNEVHLTYQNGKLAEISNAVGRKLRFLWQDNHLKQVQDLSSSPARSWEFTYKNGFLLSVKNPLNFEQNYGYDQDGKLISIRLYDDNQMFIGYHKGDVVAEIASCDFHDYFTYEREANKTFHIKETDEGSIIDTYEFDENGNLIRKKGSCCGYDMGYTYDGDLNVTEIVNGEGNVVSYSFDALGNRTSTTDPLGNTSFATYVPGTDWISSIQDKRGNTINYVRDSAGNVLQIDYPLGISESYEYDAFGNMIRHIDGEGISHYYDYDSLGNLIKIRDPLQSHLTYIRDERGNIIQEIDAKGHSTYREYDVLDRLIKTTDHLGNIDRMKYDSNSRVLSEINPLGDSIFYEYDPLGRLLRKILPEGVTYQYRYNKRGQMIAKIDPLGRRWSYRYNKRNQKIAETDPLGNTTRFIYNGIGKLISQTDALGQVSSFLYDDNGRLSQKTNAAGEISQSGFDEMGNLISQTDPMGNITQYEYDALGRKIKDIDPLGHTTQYVFNRNHELIEKIDPLGRRTQFVYDSLDRVVHVIDPAGDSIHIRYDLADNITHWLIPNGDSTTWEYNELDLPIVERDNFGQEHRFFYDVKSRLVRLENIGQNRQHYSYDKLDRVTEIRDSLGLIEKNIYDAMGMVIQKETQWGETYTYQYDALGRERKMIDPAGDEYQIIYDALGRIISETDRNGKTTRFIYDPLGRLLEEIDPLGHKIKYDYNQNGDIVEVEDAMGRATRFIYDAAGRKTGEILPDNSQANFNYDAAGQLLSSTNRNGQTIQFIYDLKGLMTKKKYPGTREDIFSYDSNGNLTLASNPWVTLSFSFDSGGRILSESCRNKSTTYVYGNNYRSDELHYPGGRIIRKNYDVRNRMKSIVEGSNSIASFTYDNGDNLISMTFGNGLQSTFMYDDFRQITKIAHDSLLTFDYTYDKESQLLTEAHQRQTQLSRSFLYDQIGSLISASRGNLQNGQIPSPNATWQYDYDAMGNRSTSQINSQLKTYQVDMKNAYTRVGLQNLSLDMQGNLLNDGSLQYVYDADNLLIEVKQSGNTLVKYNYDPLGRRTQKITSNDTIYYYYSFSHIIEERNARDSVISSYVYGEVMDEIIQADIHGQSYFFHTDWQGSVRGISNSQGQGVEYYEYSPYGEQSIFNSLYQQLASSQIGNPIGFTGRRHEKETGLIYYRSRSYHPDFGRFVQPDPLGYVDGPNMYRFALNSPGNYVDPYGLYANVMGSNISLLKWFSGWIKDRVDISGGTLNLDGITATFKSIPIGTFILSIEVSLGGNIAFCCDPYFNEININVNASVGVGLEIARGFGVEFEDKIKKLRELQKQKKNRPPWTLNRWRNTTPKTEQGFLKKIDAGGRFHKNKRKRALDNFRKRQKRKPKSDVRGTGKSPTFGNDLATCPVVNHYGLHASGLGISVEGSITGGLGKMGVVGKFSHTFGGDEPFNLRDKFSKSYGYVNYAGIKVALVIKGSVDFGGVIPTRFKPGSFPFNR